MYDIMLMICYYDVMMPETVFVIKTKFWLQSNVIQLPGILKLLCEEVCLLLSI